MTNAALIDCLRQWAAAERTLHDWHDQANEPERDLAGVLDRAAVALERLETVAMAAGRHRTYGTEASGRQLDEALAQLRGAAP